MCTQTYLVSPVKSYKPAIAKIRKKKVRIKKVSFSKGIDFKTATTKTCSPLILVTARKGLSTLKALRAPTEEPPPPPPKASYKKVSQADETITKSRMFHGSLR